MSRNDHDEHFVTSDKANRLVTNMTEILNKTYRNDAERRRRELLSAVGALQKAIDKAKERHDMYADTPGKSASAMRYQAREAVKTAHKDFFKQVGANKIYLEGMGFTDMEDKLYAQDEIDEKVKSINGGSD